MPPKASPSKPTHTVPVLCKAIRVFEAVAQSSSDTTTKGLAASLRISPTTCYRILQSYVAQGWLRQRDDGAFALSFGLVPLLRPLLRHELLIETVREPLIRLATTTGLTAKLTIRQGDDAVTIASVPSPRPHGIASRVGAIVSLAIGSSGASFLGALSDREVGRILDAAPAEAWSFQKREVVLRRVREVRRLGCCFDSGSYQPHIHTLSVPLGAQAKEVVGVITLLGFPQDFLGNAKGDFIRELKYTAGGCNQLIQGPASAA